MTSDEIRDAVGRALAVAERWIAVLEAREARLTAGAAPPVETKRTPRPHTDDMTRARPKRDTAAAAAGDRADEPDPYGGAL